MSREYTISEDKDYKKGNGVKAYIKDGKFICDVADECGNAGGEWFCDIELLRYHIEEYKSGKRDDGKIPWKTICMLFEEVFRRFGLDVNIHYVHNTITAVKDTIPPKVVTFSVEDIDKIKV